MSIAIIPTVPAIKAPARFLRIRSLPSRKRLQFANLNMAIEIVDLPSYKMVIITVVM